MPAKKKNEELVLTQEPTLDVAAIAVKEAAPEPVLMNAKAFGIAYVPKKGHTVFEIAFNTDTGAAQVVKQESFGTDKMMARERFKITVAKSGTL